jgi:uncharacterized membrane protein
MSSQESSSRIIYVCPSLNCEAFYLYELRWEKVPSEKEMMQAYCPKCGKITQLRRF